MWWFLFYWQSVDISKHTHLIFSLSCFCSIQSNVPALNLHKSHHSLVYHNYVFIISCRFSESLKIKRKTINDGSAYIEHPVNDFHLLYRFVVEWQSVFDIIFCKDCEETEAAKGINFRHDWLDLLDLFLFAPRGA